MKKDNLTDVVEQLPKVTIPAGNTSNEPRPQPQQQVINNNGETVTLGQKDSK